MRFFALETNKDKLKHRFLSRGEQEIRTVYYHGMSFFLNSVREVFVTMICVAIGTIGWYYEWPMQWLIGGLVTLWFFLAFVGMMKAYIDWCFDFIMITTDKVVIVDQTSIIHQKILPIQLENIGSVSAETQYWGLFPFGILCINLLEGYEGDQVKLKYVPFADHVAAKISDVLTHYQRRKDYDQSHVGTTPPRKEAVINMQE